MQAAVRPRASGGPVVLSRPDRTSLPMRVDHPRPARLRPRWWLHLAVVVGVLAALGAEPAAVAPAHGWSPFSSFFDGNNFSGTEQIGLVLSVVVSLFAL